MQETLELIVANGANALNDENVSYLYQRKYNSIGMLAKDLYRSNANNNGNRNNWK